MKPSYNLIIRKSEIKRKLDELILIKKCTDYDGEIFIDSQNKKWEKCLLKFEMLDKEIYILYCIDNIDSNSLLEIIKNSNIIDEIASAAALIDILNFDNNNQLRLNLLNYLKSIINTSELNANKIFICYWEAKLYEKTNKSNVLGKHYSEVKKDSDFYKMISENAKSLLEYSKKPREK